MLEAIRTYVRTLAVRLRRVERRELDAFVRWIEHTGNLLQLSVLVFVPLLIAAVTWLANISPIVSFLLFPRWRRVRTRSLPIRKGDTPRRDGSSVG